MVAVQCAQSIGSHENLRSDPFLLREQFNGIFSHPWDFIEKKTPESPWRTETRYKLTLKKFWDKYIDSDMVLGVRFGTHTVYGLYDIDIKSEYHPERGEEALDALTGELERYGICRVYAIRSSESRGIHLYFHFDRPVNTFRLACVIYRAAFDAGLEVKNGQLETFPNTKAYNNRYQGHRLPLQQGSCLLDREYQPCGKSLNEYLSVASWSAAGNDVECLESYFDEAYRWFCSRKRRGYRDNSDFYEQVAHAEREISEGFLGEIRLRVERGFEEFHQTNELLLTIAKLGRLAHGLSGEALVSYIQDTVVAAPGYVEYCRHKHEILRRCEEVARYAETHWVPYKRRCPENRGTYKELAARITDCTERNAERQHNARNRIVEAVEYIRRRDGELPDKVGLCKLKIRNVTKELFGISVSDATLRKPDNRVLWHPRYRVQQDGELKESESCGEHTPSNGFSKRTVSLERETVVSDRENRASESPGNMSAPQPVRHSESVLSENCGEEARPCEVVWPDGDRSESLNSLSHGESGEMGQTPALMKGCLVRILSDYLRFECERVYSSQVLETVGVTYLYTGYRGYGASGIVEYKGEKESKVQSILPGTNVEVLYNLHHSTVLKEYSKQRLIYIKPFETKQEWIDGIAVPVGQLVPLMIEDNRDTAGIRQNS